MYPLHRVGDSRGEGRRGAGGRGQGDQGGGQRAGVAGPGGRVVGVHLSQPRYLGVRVLHQRQEREHLAGDPRRGQQGVVVAGQVGSLVRQDRIQLGGIERRQRAGGQDHRRVAAGDAVRLRLGMVHQHGPQGRLGTPGEPGGLRVPRCLPPGGAKVSDGDERGAGQHSAGEDEAEPGHGRASGGGVLGAEPQHAGPDQVTEPAAQRGGVDRERQAGQPQRGDDRPSGGQVGEDGQQRRPGCPPGPAEHPGAQRAGAHRVRQQHRPDGHPASCA